MNFINPELLVLSGRIAVLVVIASVLAFIMGRLTARRRVVPAPARLDPAPQVPEVSSAIDELVQAHALAEELRRNLAATESQCVNALEQRDEADRQALQRAGEARKLKDELAEWMGRQTVPLEEHQGLAQQLESLKDTTQKSSAAAAQLEQQMVEARGMLETRERERAEARQEAESLRQQLQGGRAAHEGALAELAVLKQQLTAADDLAIRRQGQLELLAKEKAEAEISLKTCIAEMEAQAVAIAAAAPPSARPVQLPRPPLPPPEVLAAPVDESFDHFPPAPEAAVRKPLGESLFDEAAMASFSPEVPSLDDARETLTRLEQELQEKDQLIELLSAEQARRREDLESVRHSPPAEQHDKLHAAEKEEHAAAIRLHDANENRDRCRRQVRALNRSLQLAAEHTAQADDLTRIKGIKGGISQQLHAFGIFTYRQIVEWDAEDMLAFSELLAFKNRLHRDKWQEQARILMEAKYGKGK